MRKKKSNKGRLEIVGELEHDILQAGARNATPEQIAQVKEALRTAKIELPPELMEQMKADGIDPKEFIEEIRKGNISNVKQL